jgi:Fe-Mn family superoxide dismutase
MFTAIDLPYGKEELTPYIDSDTMELHHGMHYVGYTTKLNAALEGTKYAETSIEELLTDLNKLPEDIRQAVRNNGGGYYNHTLFFQSMSPEGGGTPNGKLSTHIEETFGSFEELRSEFSSAAAGIFGSGWAWLVLSDKELEITTTPNQDNPLTQGQTPILGLDVWEHAYYLNYQNRRPEYIEAWWNIVDWEKVTELYEAAK